MKAKQKKLAKRLVDCKRFCWMPGMSARCVDGSMLRYLGGNNWFDEEAEELLVRWSEPHDPLPNLDDPATRGCLLALICSISRAAWCEPDGTDLSRWAVYSPWTDRLGTGTSESEALVAALEAAP